MTLKKIRKIKLIIYVSLSFTDCCCVCDNLILATVFAPSSIPLSIGITALCGRKLGSRGSQQPEMCDAGEGKPTEEPCRKRGQQKKKACTGVTGDCAYENGYFDICVFCFCALMYFI